MSSILLLAVLTTAVLAVVLVVGLVVVLTVLARRGAGVGDTRTVSHRLAGRRGLLRATGTAAGVLAAWAVVADDTLGRGLLLAAPVAALGLLLGVLAAELVVRPPVGPRRSAALTPRRSADYLPRRLGAVVVTTGVTLLSLSAVTTALASPDDMGRPGRWLTYACSAVRQSSRGPWPGSFYTVPLLLLVAVGVLLGVFVLRVTVARPPLLADSTDAADSTGSTAVTTSGRLVADDELRAQSARAVVAGLGVLLALPLTGMAALAASGLGGMAGCAPSWWSGVAAALLVLALLAAVVLVWCVGVALVGQHQPALQQTALGQARRQRTDAHDR